MATNAQITSLRKMTSVTEDQWTDAELNTLIDELGLNAAAAEIWDIAASNAAVLVDVSESGSSRSLSQIQKNALTMAARYRERAAEETAAPTTTSSRTRRITRS